MIASSIAGLLIVIGLPLALLHDLNRHIDRAFRMPPDEALKDLGP